MKLLEQQKDLLIGTLLGDGNLQTETSGRTWRYRALHKAEHKEYLFHKYSVLQPLCKSPPIYAAIVDSRTNKLCQRWYFNTTVNDSLRHYGNLFYSFDPKTNTFVKNVPKNIELFLTPRAIAYWYMDDGSLKWLGKSNAMRICTESFSKEGLFRLQTALKNRFNLETSLVKKTNEGVLVGYRIAINEQNSSNFREIIRPYLVECMKYKVSDGNKSHL